MYEALHTLKSEYQTALILHYFYDFKLQEIATMRNKPLNTIKIQLHRARLMLKKQLVAMQQSKVEDVNTMLRKQLKEVASKYFKVPSNYELCVEDVNEENAIFLWKDEKTEEGYYIEFDSYGNLLALTQPVTTTAEKKLNEVLQQTAEKFLTAQYPESLQYFVLTQVKEHEDRTRFYFEQLVAGIPLERKYAFVDVAYNGQVVEFLFKGYTNHPPNVPATLAPKESILDQLQNTEWTTRLLYVSKEYTSVAASGLHIIYESPLLYTSFDAGTGKNIYEQHEDEIEEQDHYIPLPNIPAARPLETLEEIVGIPSSMEIIREAELDEFQKGFVWREKEYKAPTDKSMNSFIENRFEQTVKATVQISTNDLKGFVWFKERTGDLELTYDECKQIAVTFIKTYYPNYVPYLKMKVAEPSFNHLNRAIFTFSIFIDSYYLDGENFMLSVNRTTGFIDMFMTPRIEIKTFEAFTPTPLLPLIEAKKALQQVDAVLQWDTDYEDDEPTERLIYSFAKCETKQRIKGIDATTGKLIWMKN